MSIEHTDSALVSDTRVTEVPWSGRTTSGYGGRIPTRYMVRYGMGTSARWLRVRMMQYGNSGSAYVTTGGRDLFLDIDTEYRLQAL